jgi:integrase
MASFKKVGSVWRVQIAIKGIRTSGSFSTKAEATAWAAMREAEIRDSMALGPGADKTLQDALDRYAREVSPLKRGHHWENYRLAAIGRHVLDGRPLGERLIRDITPELIGRWRDHRLQGTPAKGYADAVGGSTVNRELNVLSHVFTTARREWKWIRENPIKDVRRPKDPEHRDRLISRDEIERLCIALGFDDSPVTTRKAAVGAAFLFAIETAMRAGEICALSRKNIHGHVAHLPRTKNGTKRDVPLSPRAIEIINLMPPRELVFDITPQVLDALFRRARSQCLIDDLKFHDTRHEAITRLAKKLSVLELARMVGHRNLSELQTYYNETAEEISKKLR